MDGRPSDRRAFLHLRIGHPPTPPSRRRFEVSAAETGDQALHRRAELAVSVVASEHGHVHDVLAACERLIAGQPESELLSTRTRVLDDDDLD